MLAACGSPVFITFINSSVFELSSEWKDKLQHCVRRQTGVQWAAPSTLSAEAAETSLWAALTPG